MRRSLRPTVFLLAACLVLSVPASAALPKPLAPLEFLLGDWDGGGGGVPGEANGGTTFAVNLQDRVVIRTNFAVVAATDKAPASRHDDLMIIYADEKDIVRADYYDNEGHVIRYTLTFPAPGRAVFTSEAGAGGPRYRLAYEASANGAVKGSFSMAAPGKPDSFTPYLDWEMHRLHR